jgi:hypothetical protein
MARSRANSIDLRPSPVCRAILKITIASSHKRSAFGPIRMLPPWRDRRSRNTARIDASGSRSIRTRLSLLIQPDSSGISTIHPTTSCRHTIHVSADSCTRASFHHAFAAPIGESARYRRGMTSRPYKARIAASSSVPRRNVRNVIGGWSMSSMRPESMMPRSGISVLVPATVALAKQLPPLALDGRDHPAGDG